MWKHLRVRHYPHDRNEPNSNQVLFVRNDPHELDEPLVFAYSFEMHLAGTAMSQTIKEPIDAVRHDPHERNEHGINSIYLLQVVRNDPHEL